MFEKDEELAPVSQQLICEIVSTTLQMCAQLNSNSQLSEKSDVLEGFFCMLVQISKKVPHLIFNNSIDTAALFQCGKFSLLFCHNV